MCKILNRKQMLAGHVTCEGLLLAVIPKCCKYSLEALRDPVAAIFDTMGLPALYG